MDNYLHVIIYTPLAYAFLFVQAVNLFKEQLIHRYPI